MAEISGHVRELVRSGEAAFYVAIRLADGHRLQRRLGKVWSKRSRPPAGYLTRSQAEARLGRILTGGDPEISVRGGRSSVVTFGVVAEAWLAYVRDDRKRRPSTVKGYRRELDNNLIPAFGRDTPIEEITTAKIDAYRERLVDDGKLSPRSINKRLAQLHAIFKRAQRVYGLEVNPAAGAERQPQRASGDITVLHAGEVELLASKASDQDGAMFKVAAFTGLRLGELRALRWGDVDWLLRLVHVRRSYTWGAEGAPKSGKVRSVPLVDQAAKALEDLSRREFWTGADDLVFVSPTGGFVEESALRRRFYDVLDAAGLPRMRFHDLRHTFGTLAVQAFPLTDVKAFMGHADIQTTMIYAHHVPRHDAADKLTQLLAERTEEPVRRTADAPADQADEPENTETPDLQGLRECRRQDSNLRHADYDARDS
jgi:integrase